MARLRSSARVVSNRIASVVVGIETNTREGVDTVAAQIQARAEATAPKDTGSLSVSIYRTNGDQSDYTQRVTRAEALNDDVLILPEIRPEFVISTSGGARPTYSSLIAAAASHGIFQELGTRFQRPQPFLLPAALGAQNDLVTVMSRVAG